MDSDKTVKSSKEKSVTVDDVNRLLDVGRLLLSVLTPEEIEALQRYMNKNSTGENIGNAGDS
jgi:hypothetical protein